MCRDREAFAFLHYWHGFKHRLDDVFDFGENGLVEAGSLGVIPGFIVILDIVAPVLKEIR